MHRHDEMVLQDLCRRSAKFNPHKTAVVSKENRFTFGEFYERTNRIAQGLIGLGVKKGDRIAVLMNNGHQYIELYFAIPKTGGIITPLNYRLAGQELSWIVNNAEASVLIFQENYLPAVEAIKSELKCVKCYICTEGSHSGTMNYGKLISQSSAKEPEVDVHDDDVVSIFYTSGTTGTPKGAMLTHRNIISNCNLINVENKIKAGDVFLIVAPMYHTITPACMYAHMYRGNTNVVMEQFDPKILLETIEKEKVSHVFLVPSMINFTLDFPGVKNYDLSSLRMIFYGGSPIPVNRVKEAMAVFGCELCQGFGMTEIGPCAVSVLSSEDHLGTDLPAWEERLSSVGRNFTNVEAKIVDPDDEEAPIGAVGEVCVRGQNVMKGYWKRPEETSEALRGGWFHTGDLGRMDEDGYLYLVDRKKDMIISGAENIYSAEVENALNSHPAVLEVAVIGVPDEKWGEAVKAVVVLREGIKATEEELIEHCKQRLASYKKPKSIAFMECLPRNVMGKVLKTELREKYWKGYEKRVH